VKVVTTLIDDMRNRKWYYLILLILTTLLFVDFPGNQTRSFSALLNLGHIALFALFSRLFFSENSLLKSHSLTSRLVLCLLFASFVGAAIELLQYGLQRDMDVGDIGRDIIGALAGFFFAPLTMDKTVKVIARTVVTGAIVYQLIPLTNALIDESRARNSLPILSDFETESEINRWRGKTMAVVSDEQVYSGVKSLRVETDTGKYSGISLVHFPSDWAGYQSLTMAVFTEDNDLSITVRVHDWEHRQGLQQHSDRFNRNFKLHRGWNTIAISLREMEQAPTTRKLNLSDVHGLGIFVTRQKRHRLIYIDRVALQ
jgi:hypothetical protein